MSVIYAGKIWKASQQTHSLALHQNIGEWIYIYIFQVKIKCSRYIYIFTKWCSALQGFWDNQPVHWIRGLFCNRIYHLLVPLLSVLSLYRRKYCYLHFTSEETEASSKLLLVHTETVTIPGLLAIEPRRQKWKVWCGIHE